MDAMLEIDPQTVYFLILKAREFDDKDDPGEADPDASPAEETIEADMHYYADDPVAQELKTRSRPSTTTSRRSWWR